MRLAIPLFGEEVAPRFCSATEILVVDLQDRQLAAERYGLGSLPWTGRLQRIAELGVETLLCGGINQRYLPLAEALGIQVIWGQRGKVTALIETFRLGQIERGVPDEPGICEKRGDEHMGRLA